MGVITTNKRVEAWGMNINIEVFNSASRVIDASMERPIGRSKGFCDDYHTKHLDEHFTGIKDWSEVDNFMRFGYEPTVEALKLSMKEKNMGMTERRYRLVNAVSGDLPDVPDYLIGLPECMIDCEIKPIKTRVINVYYDITCNCGTSTDSIIKAGQKLLGAICELEMQGYQVNLYAIQSYSDSSGADMLCVKIKNADTPIDIKRISFPLTHPAFFRVVGFDWYSRFPHSRYRSGYGRALTYNLGAKKLQDGFEEIFGDGVVVFACTEIMNKGQEAIREAIVEKTQRVSKKATW